MPRRRVGKRHHNLPAQPTPLIGRSSELNAAQARLLQPDVRLLTLTGPAGTGKTRLALALAGQVLEAFANGVWFVDLTSVSDPSLVVPAIGRALGLREERGATAAERVVAYLKPRASLLVLDNLEHVLAAAPALAHLLATCPGVKILATSRAPLNVRWEHVFPTPPLAGPDPRHLPPLADLGEAPVVALFVQRATAVRPDFQLTPDNAQAVVETCTRLDRLPLAIELAAARSDVFTPGAMLERLRQQHALLLEGGARDQPTRHQTLRAAFDWSVQLLTESERLVFRRLAVLVAPFSEDEAVELVGDRAIVANGLLALVRNSLLRTEDADDEVRFSMLQTVREYALERLQTSGELEPTRRQHARLFLRLAEEAWHELLGARQSNWLARLEREHDNFRAALRWAATEPDPEIELRLCGALWRFWWQHGYLTEGQGLLECALARQAAASPGVRAKALNGAGMLAHVQGHYARAAAQFEASLPLWREAGETWGVAAALHNLGALAREQGDYARAVALCSQSLELERDMGNLWGIATSLNNLGSLAHDQGEYDQAADLHAQSLALFREIGDQWGIALALGSLGSVARDRGEWTRAAARLDESLQLWRKLGDKWGVAVSLCELGRAMHLTGDDSRAVGLLQESLTLFEELDVKQGGAGCFETLAAVACRAGQPTLAARLLGAAEALRETTGTPLPPVDRAAHAHTFADLARRIGEPALSVAWADGRLLSWEQAVQIGLGLRLAPRRGPGPLTPREREVVALVANGLSNRQIAAALVISERTADRHVSNILDKLGFDSRAQIAAWSVFSS